MIFRMQKRWLKRRAKRMVDEAQRAQQAARRLAKGYGSDDELSDDDVVAERELARRSRDERRASRASASDAANAAADGPGFKLEEQVRGSLARFDSNEPVRDRSGR